MEPKEHKHKCFCGTAIACIEARALHCMAESPWAPLSEKSHGAAAAGKLVWTGTT